MDGLDAAVVELDSASARLVATHSASWPAWLRERLSSLAAGSPIDADGFALLDCEVGACFADAVTDLLHAHAIPATQIAAIGCHGQTVAHLPQAAQATTLQLGDANVIAERTGITTVNDFRRRDMAAGGQGAPLAPAFHAAMLRSPAEDRVILNLGGIANITILPADPSCPVIGFDTGPANCLMDFWIQQQLGKPYDKGGKWATTAAEGIR